MNKQKNRLRINTIPKTNLLINLFVLILVSVLFSGCQVISSITANEASDSEVIETVMPQVPEEKFSIHHLDLGVTQITGEIDFGNEVSYASGKFPPAVIMMEDATNLVTHNRSGIISAETQELGYVDMAYRINKFTLMLPEKPNGIFHDLDYDDEEDRGVQVFFVSLEFQHGGSPYFDNDQDWSDYFSSIMFDDMAATNIKSGYLLVWAEDDKQQFPSGFGEDGILFTEDDPLKYVKQGYTAVLMGTDPFTFNRTKEVGINLSQNEPATNRELSEMSYTESFDALFEDMKVNYAFVGIPDKEPDWNALYEQYSQKISQAEEDEDYEAFYSSLKSYASNFSDSHVSVFQLNIETQEARDNNYGYGFMVEEIPGGDIVVSYIDFYGHLLEKGLQLGDKLVSIDGQDLDAFLEENADSYGAYSREEVRRAAQLYDLTRDENNETTTFGFQISDGSILSITQGAYYDNNTYTYGTERSTRYYWPVEYSVLDSGFGYIAITSNMGGEDFTRSMFENALDDLENQGVSDIIIDLRYNHGGEMLKLVEYFLDEPVKIANLEYPGIKDVDGNALQYEVWAHPYIRQYDFNEVSVLIGSGCVSACEIEAYAFSKLPDVKMFGSEPTAGAVALISGNAYELPEWIEFNYSIGRFVDENGDIFLEGKGVSPNILMPASLGTISAPYDWLLAYADRYLQYQDVMTFDAAYDPQPTNVDVNSYIEMLKNESQIDLNTSSVEVYPGTMVPGNTYTYHTFLDTSEDIFAGYVTCTSDVYNYDSFFNAIKVRFEVNGTEVKDNYLVSETAMIFGAACRMDLLMLSDWSEGMNEVVAEVTYDQQVYDGSRWIPAGTYNIIYEIAAKDSSE